VASKRKWSLRRSRPLGSMPARRHSKAARVAEPEPSENPFAGGSVLPTVEELIARILGLVVRTIGTLTVGIAALVKREPAKRLSELERAGRVLPWGTVILFASALAGVWFSDRVSENSVRRFLSALDAENGTYRYLDLVIPTLAAGFLVSGLGWAIGSSFGGQQAGNRARLLTATLFGLTMLATCALSSSQLSDVETIYGIPIRSVDILMYGVSPLAARITWVSSRRGDAGQHWGRIFLRTVLTVLAALFPWTLSAVVKFVVFPTSLILSSYGLWPAISEESSHRIIFKQKVPLCLASGDKVLSCTFVADTSGRGNLYFKSLPISVVALPIDAVPHSPTGYRSMSRGFQEQLNDARREHHLKYRELRSEILEAKLLLPAPGFSNGLAVLEGGKPLAVEVRFDITQACASLKPLEVKEELYVALDPLEDGFEVSATFGPWTFPLDDYQCRTGQFLPAEPAPPKLQFQLKPLGPLDLPTK
jgi:hypothetical protein